MAIKHFFDCAICKGVSAGKKCIWCRNVPAHRMKEWQEDLTKINKELEHAKFTKQRPTIRYKRARVVSGG
jgi:hypothetical protein